MAVLKRIGKVAVILLLVVVCLFLLAIIAFNIYHKVNYKEFYKAASKEYNIPGLGKGFVPQGLSYTEGMDAYLTCGYMKSGSASRIYSIDAHSGDSAYIELLTQDGKADDCHAGGIAVWKNFVYLATGKTINVYKTSGVEKGLSADSKLEIRSKFSLDPGFGPAYCYAKDNLLYVGEFYIAEDYETPVEHHMTTDSGDRHRAIMTVYELSEDAEFGIKSEVPVAVYSIRDNAQGFCITDKGSLCISSSYGLSTSHISVYDNPMDYGKNGTFKMTIGGTDYDIPLYYLDSAHLKKVWDLPPMSEEIEFRDGKLHVMFESSSNKYYFGKVTGGSFVYSFPVE